MKKLLFCTITILTTIHINSYSRTFVNDPTFKKLFKTTLDKFENNSTADKYTNAIAELKRIDMIYPNEWINSYQIALLEIQKSFLDLNEKNNFLLDDAKNNIDKIKRNKKADISEVYTLEGYYYYALIAKEPKENGPKLYKDVFACYQKALKYNKNNPRANLLLLIFKMNMAGFMGQKENDICQQLDSISELFKNELFDYYKPCWGDKTLDSLLLKYCCNR